MKTFLTKEDKNPPTFTSRRFNYTFIINPKVQPASAVFPQQ